MSLNSPTKPTQAQYGKGFNEGDRDEAISLYRHTIQRFPDPGQSIGQLNQLARLLEERFYQRGQQDDIDEAISFYRQALELRPLLDSDRSMSLNHLAMALCMKFESGSRQDDLNEAISLHRQALELRPPPHPHRLMSLLNIGRVLITRSVETGQQCDIDEAILFQREALELSRTGTRQSFALSLNNLGRALQQRFYSIGQRSDIGEAISLHRRALSKLEEAPSESDPWQPSDRDRSISITHIATVLWTLFSLDGQRGDLDDTIALQRRAVELWKPIPPHPVRSELLGALGSALETRFTQDHQKIDLDEALSLHREALELRPLPHPLRSHSLNDIAMALSTRSQHEVQRVDLEEAISLHRQTIQLRPWPHPNRSAALYSLAKTLILGCSSSEPNSEYLEEAMSLFASATQDFSPPASRHLQMAKSWIREADRYQHISAVQAYQAALDALPQVAALSFDLESRQEALVSNSDGLARDASRCAIQAGNLGKAIEFLEAGRCIFWSHVLSLRSPLNQLRDIAPELADKLGKIAISLELGSHRDISVEALDNWGRLSVDREASRLNRLGEEWMDAVDEIRRLEGFEDFLRSPPLSSLKSAASNSPVIILVANNDSSHCLIMTFTDVHHIPLPSLRTSVLQELVRLVQAAVSELPISRSFIRKIQENIVELWGDQRGMRFELGQVWSSDDIFKHVLKILWESVVKPIISFLNIKKSMSRIPVLQWCLTGLFTFLPIHAAGCYDDKRHIECAPDYFISSYAPTIGSLLAQNPVPSTERFNMMVVIQSSELPGPKKELENIQRHVSRDSLVEMGVPGSTADIEPVASRLSDTSIVHFACHGKQDRLKPLKSGLKLNDGILSVSRVMKEKIPNGSLAFLGACETAMGDGKLPDEAMSLGACMLFSGFPRVIATMWEIMDKDGPTIADAFYEELYRGPDGKPLPEPDLTKSAQALYRAVNELRAQNVAFRRWVPFIHMGVTLVPHVQ